MSDDIDDDLKVSDFDDDMDDFDDGASLDGGVRDNPLFKVGMIGAAFVAVVGGIILFGGGPDKAPPSAMKGAQNVSEVPGEKEVSEDYKLRLEETEQTKVETAIKTGGSAMPRPISTPSSALKLEEEKPQEEDPLDRWRRIQEERQRQEMQKPPEKKKEEGYGDVVEALAKAMSAQMESVMKYQEPGEMTSIQVASDSFLDEAENASNSDDDSGTGGTEDKVLTILEPAGTIEYAQLITEANSDVPGPVLAQIVSGPLKGSRILGSFEVAEDSYLVLTFETVVVDGISYDANAVALDPGSANPGMVSEVDHRYFKRIILPAAAAFIEGFGSAVAETSSTTTTGSGGATTTDTQEPDATEELFKGVEEATSRISDLLDEEADKTKVLVRVKKGTPMGILFLEAVTEDSSM